MSLDKTYPTTPRGTDVRHTTTIRILRAGRAVPVRVTHLLTFDDFGWTFQLRGVRFPSSRRRYRLTVREVDRAAYASAAAVA